MSLGDKVGRLTIIGPIVTKDGSSSFSPCRCSCGTEKLVSRSAMRRGVVVSCGCYGREARLKAVWRHGKSLKGPSRRVYGVWASMIQRCENPNAGHFQNYGGRGIKVCERWHDFILFEADMGPRPPGMTVERLNNDGNYEPDNCTWASRRAQARNKSTTHIVDFRGEKHSLREVAEALLISPKLLGSRMHKRRCTAQAATDYYERVYGGATPQ